MQEYKRFNYQSLEELEKDIKDGGYRIPVSHDISSLTKSVELPNKTTPNAMIDHPMEGCDGNPDGSPGELTIRRYRRFASGGAGLIWVEACAVVQEGRANPLQLWITKDNVDTFKDLVNIIKEEAKKSMGEDFEPYLVLQLTHSGRYSRPVDKSQPLIAHENGHLDKKLFAPAKIVTDEQLMALEDKYVEAALLAQEAGFDAVDIKSCHRYLINGLLSSYNRTGIYGGSFENRSRFILNIVRKVSDALSDSCVVTTRMNAYDAIPYPDGFGVNKENFLIPDLSEPIMLIKELYKLGVRFINVSIGNPYYNPHFGRPYDSGSYQPPENQLVGSDRILNVMGDLKKAVPEMKLIATGFTWLRQYGANVGAGCIDEGYCDMVGYGRQSFAYPDFPKDIINDNCMHAKKCCITCSKCTEIMRDHGTSGCVIRDAGVYFPIYKAGRDGKESLVSTEVKGHV